MAAAVTPTSKRSVLSRILYNKMPRTTWNQYLRTAKLVSPTQPNAVQRNHILYNVCVTQIYFAGNIDTAMKKLEGWAPVFPEESVGDQAVSPRTPFPSCPSY